jgi:hypothetical protein
MKPLFKKILFSLALFWGLFLLGGLFIPPIYQMERKITIQAPIDSIFANVNDLQKNSTWSPWIKTDPTIELKWGKTTQGVGASYSWTGKHAGVGELVILKIVKNHTIIQSLDFGQMGKATSVWEFDNAPNGVEVTWKFESDAGWNIPKRYFGLFIDNFLGPPYLKGLMALKQISEQKANQAR